MNSYRGSLRIAATQDVIDAEFVVNEQQLEVKTGGETLGSWPLSDLAPDDTGTHVVLDLDGEQVIINVPQHGAFVEALSPPHRSKRRRRQRQQKVDKPKAAGKPRAARKSQAAKKPKAAGKPKTVTKPEPAQEELKDDETPKAVKTVAVAEAPMAATQRKTAETAEAAEELDAAEKPKHDGRSRVRRRQRSGRQAPSPDEGAPATKSKRRSGKRPKATRRPESLPETEPGEKPAPSIAGSPLPRPERPSRRPRNVKSALRKLLDRESWEEKLSDPTFWVVAGGIGAVIVVLLAVFATTSLGMILVLLGMVTLIVVALAVSDDLTAYSWIPGSISEATMALAGAAAMAIGGLLIWIG